MAEETAEAPNWRVRSWAAVRRRPDPLTSVAFTVPLFLVYHLGILMLDKGRRTQLDFISTWIQSLLQQSTPLYMMVTLAVALILLITVWIEQRRGAVPPHSFARVALEALVFSVLV